MQNKRFHLTTIVLFLVLQTGLAQTDYLKEIQELKARKEQIVEQEKQALKKEVQAINLRLDLGEISQERAHVLKEEAAGIRALNMENRIAIVDHRIALLERNQGAVLVLGTRDSLADNKEELAVFIDGKRAFGLRSGARAKELKYDRRTYSDMVLALGLNNTLEEGRSLEDSPYRMAGSRFFELGWQWRTRVFKKSNWLRLNYGFSFQFNGLKPKGNYIFVEQGEQTQLAEFEFELDKAKLRMDNLVFPVHFEIGPSRLKEGEHRMRYSIRNRFRMGLGGYGGFNLGTRQKLKYRRAGEGVKDKLKRDYNGSDLIYGVSGYMGFDGVLLYLKYDLNPLFKDATVEQHNISLGLRFDI